MPRTIYHITGADRVDFLQGLITNDIARLSGGLVYAALLTPQGKYIADFFLAPAPDAILLDVDGDLAQTLIPRLTMYRLRADVQIAPVDLSLHRGLGAAPADGFDDPRHPALGWRAYRDTPQSKTDPQIDWTALRVAHCIPESGIDLGPDSFILESGFERLHGVDFRKGCYVGQEVTARMKHKTELRKGLAIVSLSAPVAVGTDITADGKPVGTVHTVAGNAAIAYLRFDRAKGPMQAGDAIVTYDPTRPIT